MQEGETPEGEFDVDVDIDETFMRTSGISDELSGETNDAIANGGTIGVIDIRAEGVSEHEESEMGDEFFDISGVCGAKFDGIASGEVFEGGVADGCF